MDAHKCHTKALCILLLTKANIHGSLQEYTYIYTCIHVHMHRKGLISKYPAFSYIHTYMQFHLYLYICTSALKPLEVHAVI